MKYPLNRFLAFLDEFGTKTSVIIRFKILGKFLKKLLPPGAVQQRLPREFTQHATSFSCKMADQDNSGNVPRPKYHSYKVQLKDNLAEIADGK